MDLIGDYEPTTMGNWCQLPRVPNNSLKQLCPIYSSKEVRCTIHIRISLFFVRPHISVRHSYRVAYIFLRRCLISLIRYRARKCNFINGRFSFLCDFFFFFFVYTARIRIRPRVCDGEFALRGFFMARRYTQPAHSSIRIGQLM